VDNVEEVTQSLPIRTDFSLGMLEGLELAVCKIDSGTVQLLYLLYPTFTNLWLPYFRICKYSKGIIV
jgi:hypothetical protein